MRRRRMRVLLAAVSVAAALGTAGCGRPAQGPSAGPGRGAAGGKMRFAGIIFQEDQFFRLVQFGLQEEASKNNVEMMMGNSMSRPDKEIELVNTYAAQGVDAILISPRTPSGSAAALRAARAKGVIIIAHNTPIEPGIAAASIGSDAYDLGVQTGKAARKYIEQKLGGKARVAVIGFKAQVAEQSDQRTGGFKSQIAGMPGVQIVSEQDAWLPEMAVKRVGDILTAHPDIDVVYAANEGGTVGAVLAVEHAGKAGKVMVFGTDSSEQLLDMLLAPDNILQAITSQRPVDVGHMAVDAALKVKRGEPVEPSVSMKGIFLSREDPEGVRAFAKRLKEWTAGGAR